MAASSGDGISGAFQTMGAQSWGEQETCYLTLIKLLDNILKNPGEDKFRQLKMTNPALRAKVFDVLGAQQFLLAAGFVQEGGDVLVAPATLSLTDLGAAREALQQHANEAKMQELRRERDERIAQAKAEDAKHDKLKGKAHLSPEEQEELRKQLERDRREFEADRENNPVRDSKAAERKFGATMGDTSFLKKGGG